MLEFRKQIQAFEVSDTDGNHAARLTSRFDGFLLNEQVNARFEQTFSRIFSKPSFLPKRGSSHD